jgi:hypothetical protein
MSGLQRAGGLAAARAGAGGRWWALTRSRWRCHAAARAAPPPLTLPPCVHPRIAACSPMARAHVRRGGWRARGGVLWGKRDAAVRRLLSASLHRARRGGCSAPPPAISRPPARVVVRGAAARGAGERVEWGGYRRLAPRIQPESSGHTLSLTPAPRASLSSSAAHARAALVAARRGGASRRAQPRGCAGGQRCARAQPSRCDAATLCARARAPVRPRAALRTPHRAAGGDGAARRRRRPWRSQPARACVCAACARSVRLSAFRCRGVVLAAAAAARVPAGAARRSGGSSGGRLLPQAARHHARCGRVRPSAAHTRSPARACGGRAALALVASRACVRAPPCLAAARCCACCLTRAGVAVQLRRARRPHACAAASAAFVPLQRLCARAHAPPHAPLPACCRRSARLCRAGARAGACAARHDVQVRRR